MKKRIIGIICAMTLVITAFSWVIPAHASAEDNNVIVPESNIPLKLWYTAEAPKINEHSGYRDYDAPGGEDDGWQQWSLPLGNGYFGANVFGRAETERIQISEKTLANKYMEIDGVSYGGMNNFSETFIDFGHTNVSDYMRYLDLKTAISGVEYSYNGVNYSREYFTSYPDKALVIKLDADTAGALSFTLRPTVPYEQSYMAKKGDGMGKTGEVTSSVKDGVGYIELSGKLEYYDVDFLGIYKVYTDGGTVTASTAQHTYTDTDGTEITDTDGTIVVNGAKSAYIVVTLGTDYVQSSEVFTSDDKNKPTFQTDLDDTRAKVEGEMNAIDTKIAGKSFIDAYNTLKDAHVADYSELFGRVSIDLGCNPDDFNLTTDRLLEEYKTGYESVYLETLMFQYGRYTLIASSRAGALPAHLQGVWNTYNTAPWGSGYWHNINVQMNYWPAFSTNLIETFEAYVDHNKAFLAAAEKKADEEILKNNSDAYGEDGGNGWIIGMSSFPYRLSMDASVGNLGFTTQMFWDYYQYTQDKTILEETVYPMLISAARYITKCVESDEDGNYLVQNCDSPEVFVDGIWYYTDGTTYAQTFAYTNNYSALLAAKELGIDLDNLEVLVAEGKISADDAAILNTILAQVYKYDPIHVGLSGQIKEFREEDFYGSIGDDPNHRHVAHLSALYPGTIINSSTPAWLDAASVTLEGRSLSKAVSWAYAYKSGMYARVKDGEHARYMVTDLLKNDTFPNLYTRGWDIYQSDATYGTTDAIAEMLLQNNSGYIELLPALPSAWNTGSFTGLCAVGNFEVSAAWENGLAKTFNITSKSGGKASVYYPSITGAYVVDSDGNRVDYTTDGTNLISFETEIGETYIIYGFKKIEAPDAPTNLTSLRSTSGTVALNWSASANAESYNVYTAVGNAPTYTLIGTTNGTSFTYTPAESDRDIRTTYAVTAVSEGESARALTYTYTDEVIETPYGTVSKERVEGESFILFAKAAGATEYQFHGTGTQIVVEGFDKARSLLKGGADYYQGGTIVIYLLEDTTATGTESGAGWNAAPQIDGTVIVDLAGHTLTSTAPRLIGFETKSGNNGYEFVTDFIFKNGTLKTSKPIVEVFGNSGIYTGTKIINISFDNVSLKPNGSSRFTLFNARGSYTTTQKAEFNIEFTDCTMNYSGLSGMVLINDTCTEGTVACNVSINNVQIAATSESDFTIAKGFADEDRTSESNLTYTYGDMIDTPYGMVSKNLVEGKSFIVFAKTKDVSTYTFDRAGTHFADEALDRSRQLLRDGRAYQGGTVVIYLLTDCTSTGTASSGSGWNAAPQIDGTVIIDLAGHTLTQTVTRFVGFEAKTSNDGYDFTTNYEIKNGTFKTSAPLFEVFGDSGIYEGTKKINIKLDSVTLIPNGTSGFSLFVAKGDYSDTQKAEVKIELNDCDLEYGALSNMALIDDRCTAGTVDFNVTVNGGKIVAKSFDDFTITKGFADEDSIIYKNGKNAIRTEFVLSYTSTAPTLSFKTDDGVKHLASLGIDNVTAEESRTVTYRLSSIKTPYGYIPEHHKDKPFSLFYNNLHISSHDTYSGAEETVKSYLYDNSYGIYKGETLTLYMKKNYTHTAAPNGNFSQQFGTYVLDLGGHTLTMTSYGLIDAAAKKVNEKLYLTAAVVRNGTILTGESPLVLFNSKGTSGNFGYDGTKPFSFTFENVTFEKSPAVSTYAPIISVSRFDETTTKNMYVSAEFNNCEFTIIDSTMFDLSVSNYIDTDIKINGGIIKTNSLNETIILKASDNDDKLTFGMVNGGNYTALTLPRDSASPNIEYNIVGGTAIFVKISENRDTITYRLRNKIITEIDFTPKTSITLDRNLIYNVYVPVNAVLKSFVLDGTAYGNLATLENIATLSDGKQYYRLQMELPASEAARNIILKAVITVDGIDYNGTWTMSIPKYAAQVMNDGNAVEVQLVKDVLAYVRAAYAYFDETDAEAMAKINALLGENYDSNNAPSFNGSADVPTTGLDAVAFVLNATPAIRFYISDTNAEYEFFINGTKLATKEGSDGDGIYLEMDVYAYAMCETITYKMNGVESGSYHINSYYQFVTTDEEYKNDAELINLVERFAKYCEIAKAYRNYVLSKNSGN